MIKITTLSGKVIEYDEMELNRVIQALWNRYVDTGFKEYDIAHTIVCSAIYGKIEKGGK